MGARLNLLIFGLLTAYVGAGDSFDPIRAAGVNLQAVYDGVIRQDGNVDFEVLSSDPVLLQQLDAYLATWQNADPLDLYTPEQRMAHFANLYNACVLRGVVDSWPVSSINDIAPLLGFFSEVRYTVGGRQVSLNNLEKQWLRPIDPRAHFLMFKAAADAPQLYPKVLVPDGIWDVADRQVAQFVNNSEHVYYEPRIETLWVSKLFEWYRDDFGPDAYDFMELVYNHKEGVRKLGFKNIRFQKFQWKLPVVKN